MFTTFDLTNRGYVTRQQYLKGSSQIMSSLVALLTEVYGVALTAVGIKETNAAVPFLDRIDRETFVANL